MIQIVTDTYLLHDPVLRLYVSQEQNGRWIWSEDLREATVFNTPGEAEVIRAKHYRGFANLRVVRRGRP